LNWNLLANNSWYANCYFVWDTYWYSLANFDCLLLAYWNANCVRNFLANCFAGPVANCVVASTNFRNHGALAYTNVLGSLLANPVAGLVANSLGAALRNHFAGRIVNNLAMALRNHLAGRVANSFAAWLANIAANRVVAGLAMAFWDHLACCVADSLLTALRNHLANCVRNFFRYAASLVTNAVNFLSFAGWNPNLLANGLGWALNAFHIAASWYIDALALRLVPNPATWSTVYFSYYWTWNLFALCFPVSTVDSDCLGVVNRVGYSANNLSGSLLLYGNHDSVVNYLLMLFTNRLHDCVVDNSLTSFIHRLANRVVDDLFVCFTNRLHHCVVDNL
jgi:hypothetical protein